MSSTSVLMGFKTQSYIEHQHYLSVLPTWHDGKKARTKIRYFQKYLFVSGQGYIQFHLDVTVQVLGTGQTGNWELSHWLTQFSMVLIGREGSCDVETAAVKRAVRTWRPGKGCGRGAAREGWSGVGKTGKWWMRQRWTRACLLALQVTMECKDGRRLGACAALATAEELNPFISCSG